MVARNRSLARPGAAYAPLAKQAGSLNAQRRSVYATDLHLQKPASFVASSSIKPFAIFMIRALFDAFPEPARFLPTNGIVLRLSLYAEPLPLERLKL